jgi:UDP-N-acetylglucosamine 2-epimerase (non-hydrolysing)
MIISAKKVLFVFGTRPEAIKMAPIIRSMKNSDRFTVRVCVTAQHREMLDQVLTFFKIAPDHDLNLMKPDQTLFDITAQALKGLEAVLLQERPDIIMVQGDTTSAFVGALAGFYSRTKIAHVEAGLRSGNKNSPYPEEMNRILAGHLANYHFAPTDRAAQNLYREGITSNVHVVGNSVIDALHLGLAIIKEKGDAEYQSFFRFVDLKRRVVLVTGHRRESFGKPFEQICTALKRLADTFDDVEIVYPVHLNPNVQEPVHRIMQGHNRIHLIDPLSYPYLIWLMNRAYLVITDSGGIQEEAPSLGKPVLVMRDVTERTEGIEAGTARLVGTEMESILSNAESLLTDRSIYEKMARSVNPYGDGKTAQWIREALTE